MRKGMLLGLIVAAMLVAVAAPVFGESALERVLRTGTLRVVCILSTPPFGGRDPQGNPIGYDVDIAKELAASLGVRLEVIDSVDAANRVPYIQTGKADVAIATLGITLPRAQVINYTDPYIRDGQCIVTRKGTEGVLTVEDLAGRTVGVVRGGPQDSFAESNLGSSTIIRYGTVADVFLALRQNKVDAVIESKVISDYQASLASGEVVVGAPFTTLYWGFGVPKGDYDWINYLNIFIRHLNITGKNAELYAKWFGGATPPRLMPEY